MINLGWLEDMIQFGSYVHSLINSKGGNFIEHFVSDCKGMRKYKNRDEETEQNKNRTQIKFNRINPILQTNANWIITVTTNDVQCKSSVKCIRDSSIESIPKLFEITN